MATLQLPVAGSYTIPRGGTFGAPRGFIGGIDYGTHKGLDFSARSGTTVVAALGGRVVHSAGSFDQHIGAGNHIHVEHGGGLESRYIHLLSRFVREGQMVAAGQPIGAVGSSGTATGPHLHFEVLTGGRHVDPAPYVGLAGAAGVAPGAQQANAPEARLGDLVPEAAPGTYPNVLGSGGGRCDVAAGYRDAAWIETLVRPELEGYCFNPNIVGGVAGAVVPQLLEPALNLAILGGSALLVYAGLRKMLA